MEPDHPKVDAGDELKKLVRAALNPRFALVLRKNDLGKLVPAEGTEMALAIAARSEPENHEWKPSNSNIGDVVLFKPEAQFAAEVLVENSVPPRIVSVPEDQDWCVLAVWEGDWELDHEQIESWRQEWLTCLRNLQGGFNTLYFHLLVQRDPEAEAAVRSLDAFVAILEGERLPSEKVGDLVKASASTRTGLINLSHWLDREAGRQAIRKARGPSELEEMNGWDEILRDVLQAMYELSAFDEDSRKSALAIVSTAVPPEDRERAGEPKLVLRRLADLGCADSVTGKGRGSGYYLTQKGLAYARCLQGK